MSLRFDQSQAIVIGAGSAGLATAAKLQANGLDVTILERGTRPGQQWWDRPENLRLNTVRGLSGLPERSIPRSAGTWPRGTDFAEYLRSYADHHELRIRFNRTVVQVDCGHRTGSAWSVQLADGETLSADVVVVATGWAARPHIPAWPGEFHGRLLHATDYRTPEEFAGRSVLVVGSGNSGAEIAVELLGTASEVRLAVRTPPLLIPGDPVLHYFGALFWWLPDSLKDRLSLVTHRRYYADLAQYGLPQPSEGACQRFARDRLAPTADHGFADAVRSGRLTVVAAVEGFTGDGVLLSDGQVLQPDVVVAATGYMPSFDQFVGHLGVLDKRGLPVKPGAVGLHFVGEPSLRGDLHMHGVQAGRVVRALSRSTASARSNTKRTSDV